MRSLWCVSSSEGKFIAIRSIPGYCSLQCFSDLLIIATISLCQYMLE